MTAGPKLSGWGAELLEDPAPFADLVRGDPGWRALLSGQPSKAKAAPGSPLERRIRSERAAVLEQLGRLVAEAQGRYLRRRAELTDGLSEPAQALLRRSEAFETAAGPSGVKLEGPAGWLAAGAPGEPPCAVKDPELSLCGVEGPAVTEPVMTEAGGDLWDPARWLAAAVLEAPKAKTASAASFGDFERLLTAELPPPLAEEDDVLDAAEALRSRWAAAAKGQPGEKAARALGLLDGPADALLRRAAEARLERGAPGDCATALTFVQRSRDHLRPDTPSAKNPPRMFALLARAALCAGRSAEAIGAARALSASFEEAKPAEDLIRRGAVAEIIRRGATGEQKTNH